MKPPSKIVRGPELCIRSIVTSNCVAATPQQMPRSRFVQHYCATIPSHSFHLPTVATPPSERLTHAPSRSFRSFPRPFFSSSFSSQVRFGARLVTLTFEDAPYAAPVGVFHNGGAGPAVNYGISFSSNVELYAQSPTNVVAGDSQFANFVVNVAGGFTGSVSFK